MDSTRKPSGPARPFDALFFGIVPDAVEPKIVQKKLSGPRFRTISGKMSIVHREKRVRPPRPPKPAKKVFLASHVERIQWVTLEKPRQFYLRWKPACNIIRRKGLAYDSSVSPSLYEKFLNHLELVARRELIAAGSRRTLVLKELRHLATGKAEGEEEFGNFIKFILFKRTFVLPQSFFGDFASVIIDLSARVTSP